MFSGCKFTNLKIKPMKTKWIIVDGDIDFTVQRREFNCLLTYHNWKRLDRFCRIHSKRYHIARDYDCTGQVCGTYCDLKVENNKFVLYLTTNFDY